jgi:hypothetical protein
MRSRSVKAFAACMPFTIRLITTCWNSIRATPEANRARPRARERCDESKSRVNRRHQDMGCCLDVGTVCGQCRWRTTRCPQHEASLADRAPSELVKHVQLDQLLTHNQNARYQHCYQHEKGVYNSFQRRLLARTRYGSLSMKSRYASFVIQPCSALKRPTWPE